MRKTVLKKRRIMLTNNVIKVKIVTVRIKCVLKQ